MRSKICFISCLLLFGSFLSAQEYQLSKPLVRIDGGGFFTKKADITFDFRLEGASLRYTLDGTEPTEASALYRKKLTVKKSSIVKVKAFKTGFRPSETITTEVHKLGKAIKSIELSPGPGPSYAGQGGQTLIDQQAGSLNFRDGRWIGYNKGPITITLDLGKVKKVEEILVSTLTAAGAWIMPPTTIAGKLSEDDREYTEVPELQINEQKQEDPSGKVYYHIKTENARCRYVKLVIQPLPTLPDWHPGKGNAGWVFLDEIIIR